MNDCTYSEAREKEPKVTLESIQEALAALRSRGVDFSMFEIAAAFALPVRVNLCPQPGGITA